MSEMPTDLGAHELGGYRASAPHDLAAPALLGLASFDSKLERLAACVCVRHVASTTFAVDRVEGSAMSFSPFAILQSAVAQTLSIALLRLPSSHQFPTTSTENAGNMN